MSEDYYALLGVEPDASEEAILQAYREKAAEHHPDVSEAVDAEATFQRLNRAKEILTDAERRRQYDRVGHDSFVGGDGDGQGRAAVDVEHGPDQPTRATSWPSGLGSLFEQVFAGYSRRQPSRHVDAWPGRHDRGQSPFDVDLTDWLRCPTSAQAGVKSGQGGSRDTSAARPERRPCPKCRGRGSFVHDIDTARGRTRRIERCEQCDGSGSVPK